MCKQQRHMSPSCLIRNYLAATGSLIPEFKSDSFSCSRPTSKLPCQKITIHFDRENVRNRALLKMSTLQLHRAKRFEIIAPVTFWWSPSGAPVHSGKGTTRNVSTTGVLVVTDECPAKGAPIQMTIRMVSRKRGERGMKLKGEGIVTRVEKENRSAAGTKPAQFAASVHFYLEPTGSTVKSR